MNNVEIKSDTLKVTLHPFGARITGIVFAGEQLALAYENHEKIATDSLYLGASIGPIANRIKNAAVQIGRESFTLPANEGPNCLHSGGSGFDQELWEIIEQSATHLIFSLDFNLKKIGMQGVLNIQASYRINTSKLIIEYRSQCNADTYVNTTNHVYFNLSGCSSSNTNTPITDHQFKLYGQNFVDVDSQSLPTGELTALSEPLEYSISEKCKFKNFDGGIDHHFNVDNDNDTDLKLMLHAKSSSSGIAMKAYSTSPGYQFYTGKHLQTPFTASGGFCVETQYAPDAINQTSFFSPLLKASQPRVQRTEYHFS